MLTDCLPLRALLLSVAGWVHREQQRTIECLIEENRVLKEQMLPSSPVTDRVQPHHRSSGADAGDAGRSREEAAQHHEHLRYAPPRVPPLPLSDPLR